MLVQGVVLSGCLGLLYSLGIAGLAYRHLGPRAPQALGDAIALGVGAAPFVVGLVTLTAIGLLGTTSDTAYLVFTYCIAVALVVANSGVIRRMGREVWVATRVRLQSRPLNWRILFRLEAILSAVLLLLLAWLVYLVVAVPLIENDALEYANVGKVMYERRSLDAYPLVEADPSTGMYAPWTHPPMYVALIFLAYVTQGGGEMPGVMRLIALWSICAVLWLLARLALRSTPADSRWRTALLACVLVLSTPLVRSMIGGASIDALPMLGLTLAFSAVVFSSDADTRSRVALGGVGLGLSLLAHSSAIVFPALVLTGIVAMRWTDRKPWLIEAIGVLFVATVVGFLPYLRNALIFGSPISDNPAVFALRELDWESYFTIGRGMSTTDEMIVRGVLRGWTDQSGFWLTFWFMTGGLGLLAVDLFRRRLGSEAKRVLIGAATIITVFHVGMLVSVLLGTALMIKNARYLLSILPLVALFGGYALSRIADRATLGVTVSAKRTTDQIEVVLGLQRCRPSAAVVFISLYAFLYLAVQQVAVDRAYWRSVLGSLRGALIDPQDATLRRLPFYRVQAYIQKALPPEAVILSLRPADMFYAKHRMISYLDPRLIPAYREPDPRKLAEMLRTMGITYVYKPNYSLPVVYNSALMHLLTDPALSRVVHSDGGYTVYALTTEPVGDLPVVRSWDLAPSRHPWTGTSGPQFALLADWCETNGIRVDSDSPQPTVRACSWIPRHHAVYVSGLAPQFDPSAPDFILVEQGGLYRYRVDVGGSGMLRIWVYEKRGPQISVQQIDDAVVVGLRRTLEGVFRVPEDVNGIRIALQTEGRGELRIHDVQLEALPATKAANGGGALRKADPATSTAPCLASGSTGTSGDFRQDGVPIAACRFTWRSGDFETGSAHCEHKAGRPRTQGVLASSQGAPALANRVAVAREKTG